MRTVKYKFGESFDGRSLVLALGFFDGVHKGHRSLILAAVEEAKRRGVCSAVFTFAYGGGLKGERAMIYGEDEREMLLRRLGVDIVFEADFEELRTLSPEDFIKKTVIRDIGADTVFAGYDYRFGNLGRADAKMLSALMENEGKRALIFDAVKLGGEAISSTRVRTSLENGDVTAANEMLGVPYFLTGRVEHGRGDGHSFGFPTVNIPVPDGRVRLMCGVYLTAVKIGEKLYTGLTNAGECPSFGKRNYHTETYILGFSDDVYGSEVEVYFLDFLRKERVFSSSEELAEQIKRDIEAAEKLKEKIKWQEIGLV